MQNSELIETSEEAYKRIVSTLSPDYDAREARAVAFLVLEEAFGIGRTDVYAAKEHKFTSTETQTLYSICQRLKAGEPVQYVLGRAQFDGRTFAVSPAVLVPRPETEELVERAAAAATATLQAGETILDAGTGSGCIAVSLSLRLPDNPVEAWDISAEALALARENARQNGAEVTFEQRDLLAPAPAGKHFGMIVSNPPYVRLSERTAMEKRVKEFEPGQALFVPDDDALRFYKALARLSRSTLKRGGWLLVEINSALGHQTVKLFEGEGFAKVELHRDSFGHDRIVCCQK